MEFNFLTSTFYHWLVRMTTNLLFVEYNSNQYFKIWTVYQPR